MARDLGEIMMKKWKKDGYHQKNENILLCCENNYQHFFFVFVF